MDYSKFVKEQERLCTKICDLLMKEDVSAEVGEMTMLWLAGLSIGRRQVPLSDGSPHLGMLAVGWQIGAADPED